MQSDPNRKFFESKGYEIPESDMINDTYYQGAKYLYQKENKEDNKRYIISVYGDRCLIETVLENSNGQETNRFYYEARLGADLNVILNVMENIDSDF